MKPIELDALFAQQELFRLEEPLNVLHVSQDTSHLAKNHPFVSLVKQGIMKSRELLAHGALQELSL